MSSGGKNQVNPSPLWQVACGGSDLYILAVEWCQATQCKEINTWVFILTFIENSGRIVKTIKRYKYKQSEQSEQRTPQSRETRLKNTNSALLPVSWVNQPRYCSAGDWRARPQAGDISLYILSSDGNIAWFAPQPPLPANTLSIIISREKFHLFTSKTRITELH